MGSCRLTFSSEWTRQKREPARDTTQKKKLDSEKMYKLVMRGEGGQKEEFRKRMELRKYFLQADKDNNGFITKDEWFSVLNSAGVPTTMREVEGFFKILDKNLDGKLSFEEFLGEENHIEKIFKTMDKDNDGFVSKSEFHAVCPNLSRDQVDKAFSTFDTNSYGKLNYKEFCIMVTTKEQERLRGACRIKEKP